VYNRDTKVGTFDVEIQVSPSGTIDIKGANGARTVWKRDGSKTIPYPAGR